MAQLKRYLSDFLREEEGASGIEYALIAAMVAVVIAGLMTDISAEIKTIFEDIGAALKNRSGS